MSRRTAVIAVTAVATAAVLAIGGGTALAMGAGGAPAPAPAAPAAATDAPAPGPLALPHPVVDRPDVDREALRIAGGGVITRIELDQDPRRWEIQVRNGDVQHEIVLDGTTGVLIRHDVETVNHLD